MAENMGEKVVSNEVLLRQILLRLPVKPLIRFKCVSKHWLALISDPKFCHFHTLRQYKQTSLRPFPSALLLATSSSPSRSPITPLKNSSSSNGFRYVKLRRMTVIIMQSCNGLFLIEGRPLINPTNNPLKARHFVYNPTTNHYVPIEFPTPQFRSSVLSLILSFEPSRSRHYKIVAIRFRNVTALSDDMFMFAMRNPSYVLNVYSSETGTWSDPGVALTSSDNKEMVYSNGAIYWYRDNAKNSKYFDVENLCFKKYPMPVDFLDDFKKNLYFGESSGHLHLVMQSVVDFSLDVLELSEDRSAWSMKFHLNVFESLLSTFPLLVLQNNFRLVDVYCVVRGEKEEESVVVFTINGRFMSHTLLGSTVRELTCFTPFLRDGAKSDVFHYYENLSSVTPFKS